MYKPVTTPRRRKNKKKKPPTMLGALLPRSALSEQRLLLTRFPQNVNCLTLAPLTQNLNRGEFLMPLPTLHSAPLSPPSLSHHILVITEP